MYQNDELYLNEKSKDINIAPAKKGKDSINFGIQIMKRFKINITKTSLNLINELNNYKWAVNADGEKTNKPIDRFNHAIDAVRYYVMYLFGEKKKTLSILGHSFN